MPEGFLLTEQDFERDYAKLDAGELGIGEFAYAEAIANEAFLAVVDWLDSPCTDHCYLKHFDCSLCRRLLREKARELREKNLKK